MLVRNRCLIIVKLKLVVCRCAHSLDKLQIRFESCFRIEHIVKNVIIIIISEMTETDGAAL